MIAERRAVAVAFALFGALALGSAAPGCGDTVSNPGRTDAILDGGGSAETSAAADSSVPDAPGWDGFVLDSDPTIDVGEPDTAPPDAGPLPDAPCKDASDDGGACPPPAAYCLDLRWLATYTASVCTDGTCVFTRVLIDCNKSGGSYCFDSVSGAGCRAAIGK